MEQVINKARGVFIWVRLVVDILAKGVRDGTPLAVLQDTVSQLPEELKDLYSHTLRRIDSEYATEAYIMLQIALCSISPLPLAVFIQCASYARKHQLDEPASFEDMTRHLTSRSGGLLETVSHEQGDDVPSEVEEVIDISSSESGTGSITANDLSKNPETTYDTVVVQFIH